MLDRYIHTSCHPIFKDSNSGVGSWLTVAYFVGPDLYNANAGPTRYDTSSSFRCKGIHDLRPPFARVYWAYSQGYNPNAPGRVLNDS